MSFQKLLFLLICPLIPELVIPAHNLLYGNFQSRIDRLPMLSELSGNICHLIPFHDFLDDEHLMFTQAAGINQSVQVHVDARYLFVEYRRAAGQRGVFIVIVQQHLVGLIHLCSAHLQQPDDPLFG